MSHELVRLVNENVALQGGERAVKGGTVPPLRQRQARLSTSQKSGISGRFDYLSAF